MKRVACIGECMIELNGPAFGNLTQGYGGDVFNTATYLARMSAGSFETLFVSAVGTDALSDQLLERWQDQGLNTRWVLRHPSKIPGVYQIALDSTGEREFHYWRHDSAARYMVGLPQWTDMLKQLATEVCAVYFSGITLAILPANDRKLFLDMLAELRQRGVSIIFDSNYRAALWPDLEDARRACHKALKLSALALLTFNDEQSLWADQSPEATLIRTAEAGAGAVIVKQDSQGAWYLDDQQRPNRVPVPGTVRVVDTTAAGDAFNAGFISAWLGELPLRDCVHWGNRLAGQVIGHKGAVVPESSTQQVTLEFQQTLAATGTANSCREI